MRANFRSSLDHVLVHEGGFADHPQDPGGATMKGVTLRTFQRFFGADKTADDLRNITTAQLRRVYRTGYWNVSRCNDLPAGVDYAVFDAAVNSGPGNGAKWLQGAVGAAQDGAIGPETLTKAKAHEPIQVVNDMCDRRLGFLRSLTTWPVFGLGWQRRVDGVRATAVGMAGGTAAIEVITPSVDFRTTKLGSRGRWVRKLQGALGLEVDGTFDSVTEEAVKAYQEAHGLEVDGIAGRETYRALGLLA